MTDESPVHTGGCGMTAIHGDTAMGWELFGRGAVRQGKYKLVHIETSCGGREDGKWQLYDLERDPGETEDLADMQQDKYKELLEVWDRYRAETGVVWGFPIKSLGLEWDRTDDKTTIGGDAITQTQAWMKARENGLPGE